MLHLNIQDCCAFKEFWEVLTTLAPAHPWRPLKYLPCHDGPAGCSSLFNTAASSENWKWPEIEQAVKGSFREHLPRRPAVLTCCARAKEKHSFVPMEETDSSIASSLGKTCLSRANKNSSLAVCLLTNAIVLRFWANIATIAISIVPFRALAHPYSGPLATAMGRFR